MVFRDGDELCGKMYLVSPDGALREGPTNDEPRLPAFSSNNGHAPEDVLNPFLVAINAEIAFRHFKRQPHDLCSEYTDLINLTIELVDKIYFKPLVNNVVSNVNKIRASFQSRDAEGDVNTGEVDEFGTSRAMDRDQTITTKATRSKGSRTGTVVRPPGPDASHDEVIEYRQYLMSGCGMQALFFFISVYHVWLILYLLDYYDEDEDEDEEDAEDEYEEEDNGGNSTSFDFSTSSLVKLIHGQ